MQISAATLAPLAASTTSGIMDPPATKPLRGSVARANVEFASNFNAHAWVDLFAGAPAVEGGITGFEQALAAARDVSRGAAPAVGVFHVDGGVYEIRTLEAHDVVQRDQTPRSAKRVPFSVEDGWPGPFDYRRSTTGVLPLDGSLRAIVDGDGFPWLAAKG